MQRKLRRDMNISTQTDESTLDLETTIDVSSSSQNSDDTDNTPSSSSRDDNTPSSSYRDDNTPSSSSRDDDSKKRRPTAWRQRLSFYAVSFSLKAITLAHSFYTGLRKRVERYRGTVISDTFVSVTAHSRSAAQTLYSLTSCLTLPFYMFIRFGTFGIYSVVNYSMSLSAMARHKTDPFIANVIYAESSFHTLLSAPEFLEPCRIKSDLRNALLQTPCIDHGSAFGLVKRQIDALRANRKKRPVLLYQLAGTDITSYMEHTFFTNDITVYDLAVYFSRVDDLMIIPETATLTCMLDNDTLDTVEWFSCEVPLIFKDDPQP